MQITNLFKILVIIWVLVVLLACVFILSSLPIIKSNGLLINPSSSVSFDKNSTAIINKLNINIEIVTTTADMNKGLSDRKVLDQNSGMLFIYDNYNVPKYWMEGVNFPLDIVWIKDNRIVGFEQNVPVASTGTLPRYSPKEPINRVLELNAGFIQQNEIKVGDEFRILTKIGF